MASNASPLRMVRMTKRLPSADDVVCVHPAFPMGSSEPITVAAFRFRESATDQCTAANF